MDRLNLLNEFCRWYFGHYGKTGKYIEEYDAFESKQTNMVYRAFIRGYHLNK